MLMSFDVPERPKIAGAAISLVLRAHNVADSVAKTIRRWTKVLDELERDYELFLVDDGSTDGTAAVVQNLTVEYPRLKVLQHETRLGFGAALRTGLEAAGHPLLFYSTCNESYQPGQLKKLLERIDEVDLVSGFRAGRPMPGWLRVLALVRRCLVRLVFGIDLRPAPGWLGWKPAAYRKLVRWLFGIRLGDIDSAFKLFRRSIFDRIPLQSAGRFVHAEILAKANFLGCIMDEVGLEEQAEWHADDQRWTELRRTFWNPEFALPPPGKPVELSIAKQ
jgi:glycosyltransferase involved in cell wall biosynthesis